MVWYSPDLENVPKYFVIHTVKGFSVVNEAEVKIPPPSISFFLYDSANVGNLISSTSAFSKSSLNIRKFSVHVLLKPDLKNFLQFVVIQAVKRLSIVNEAEVDVFLELSCFFDDPAAVGNLISGSSAFSKTSLNIWQFTVHVLPS